MLNEDDRANYPASWTYESLLTLQQNVTSGWGTFTSLSDLLDGTVDPSPWPRVTMLNTSLKARKSLKSYFSSHD